MNIKNIHTVRDLGTYNGYQYCKDRILSYSKRIGGSLRPPESYQEGVEPVATATVLHYLPALMDQTDKSINEYYLFIEMTKWQLRNFNERGLFIPARGPLGTGFYFYDKPLLAITNYGEFFRVLFSVGSMTWNIIVKRSELRNISNWQTFGEFHFVHILV